MRTKPAGVLLPKVTRLGDQIPRIKWTPIDGLEFAGKKGRIQVKGRAFDLKFDDCLDLVHCLEKVGLVQGARMLPAHRRAAIVNRELLGLERALATGERGKPHPEATPDTMPPSGMEDCFYLGVWTPREIFEHYVFYLEDCYIVLHRMLRILQGLHPRGELAAEHARQAAVAAALREWPTAGKPN